jgi:hypothetical protein
MPPCFAGFFGMPALVERSGRVCLIPECPNQKNRDSRFGDGTEHVCLCFDLHCMHEEYVLGGDEMKMNALDLCVILFPVR